VIGHPPGNLLSLALGVRPAPPFFFRIDSKSSSEGLHAILTISRRDNNKYLFSVFQFFYRPKKEAAKKQKYQNDCYVPGK